MGRVRAGPQGMMALAEIEARRAELDIPIHELERGADLSGGHYWRLLTGGCAPRPSTLARLEASLQRLASRANAAAGERALEGVFRLSVVVAALATGADAAAAQASDPARRATQDPEWMAAAQVRRLAVYLINAGLGLSQTETAKAAGMSKQAVSQAVREIEERRSDKAFERLVAGLETAIMGEV